MVHAMRRWMLLVIVMALGFGCARPAHLPIVYQLPPAASDVQTEAVGFAVTDTRTRSDLLGPAARKELPDFTGRFTLYSHHTVGDPVVVGEVDAIGLFDRVFRDALARQRIPLAAAGTSPKQVFQIDIQRFELERVALKWFATIDYTASLLVDGKPRKTQTVQGTAERVLIMARKDATKVLSELVTDVAGRLDTATLFAP